MDRITAIYLRVSTDKQNSGLEAQDRVLREFCIMRGYKNVRAYSDLGVSGSKSSRPALDDLMKQVLEGKVERVIVYSFSRFARSTKHLLEALAIFKKYDVAFTSHTENIDTSQAIGQAMFTIIAAISELERELIRERVSNGLKNAVAKGKKLGRKKSRNSELIRELRKSNMSYRKISELTKCSPSTVCRELNSVSK
jgi:DNA invertase Pin-like site-specific DNA recombinase